MASEPLPHESHAMRAAMVPFKRRLVWPAVLLVLAEVLLVVLPLWQLFELGRLSVRAWASILIPTGLGAAAVWWFAVAHWLWPVRAAVRSRRRGEKVGKDVAARAYRSTLRMPLRSVALRTLLWAGAGAMIGGFLSHYAGAPLLTAAHMAAVAGLHGFVIAAVRGLWLAQILASLRQRLFTISPPLRRFADAYFRRLLLIAVVVWAGCIAAQVAFVYSFVPMAKARYLDVVGITALASGAALLLWTAGAYHATRLVRGYCASALGDTGHAPDATAVYRRTQGLPYRLAALAVLAWTIAIVVAGLIGRLGLGLPLDNTLIIGLVTLVMVVAGAIYGSLWFREALRPLLAHVTQRYRIPVRGIAPSLSLRSKLLLSFGGVVVLACGLALGWAFLQYKRQATEAVDRQAGLGLAWLRSEIQAQLALADTPPSEAAVREAMQHIARNAPESSAVLYHVASDETVPPAGFGGGPMGAPALPWYARLRVLAGERGTLALGPVDLEGRGSKLLVMWRGQGYALGSVAVMHPSYRGRGTSMVRPLRDLLLFFIVLFAACAGIVAATVGQFVTPIRRLERRAEEMARGELADPVASSGEGDEIGRLTFALEEMRRALREKLRSTEEVNLDLERAVQMRTSDLAKKNRELAETLTKLTQTQAQLVRSEKLASIGQLVAGIAHEINNPVNAIVNTVGPLEEAIADVTSDDAAKRQEAATDIRDMVRVVQRGAQRTKAIVGALHNYSRTDDEVLVEFDLNRSLDDSLELLRHLLKHNIVVERAYGAVGKVTGHAGQISQVFMNLLTNAAQAVGGRDGASIKVATSIEGGLVMVRITDNGPGIPAEVLPRIWDPFFTTKDVGEGTGLGLSIVHELVARHHGTIECDSDLGTGTSFTVRLPRVPPA